MVTCLYLDHSDTPKVIQEKNLERVTLKHCLLSEISSCQSEILRWDSSSLPLRHSSIIRYEWDC